MNLIGNQVKRFGISGHISAANADRLAQELQTAVKTQDYTVFIVDMAGVDFIDSTGLMTLVSACRHAREMGRRFCLSTLGPSVRIVIELTGLDNVFEIIDEPTRFEAFAA
ncbi:MAG: STAS domain-containing protein [Cyanobacteria bacterium P01_H01_bin.15]